MTNNSTNGYGQSLLRAILSRAIAGSFIENARPDWLQGLELDFYFPQHELGFEFQGDQHFAPVFGQADFLRQQANDARKRKLCKERGCVLVKYEAIELQKPRVKRKIFAALNWYRPIADRKTRREWVKSILVKKGDRPQLKQSAREYCAVLRKRFDSVTALPKQHRRKRRLALMQLEAANERRNET